MAEASVQTDQRGAPGGFARAARALVSTPARRALAALAVVAVAAVAFRAARPREVAGWRVERRTLVQRVVASGRVLPPARIALGSVSLARVAEVRADEGDRVEPGQLLLRLDDAEARAALLQARARVAEAAARVDQVRGPGSRAAGEALVQAELQVGLAEQELSRRRRLHEAGSTSAALLDEAEKALGVARSQRDGAAAQVASVAAAGPDRRLAVAALEEARAAEAAARARLDDKELRAPAAGTVILRDVEPGDVVAAGKTLLVLSRAGETRLSVDPDEKNLALLRVGQQTSAVADAFPDAPFAGEVSFVAPAVDAARGTVEVRVRVPAPPPFLRPDMTVSVNVEVARRAGALVVPADAVRDAAGAPWVLVVEDGRAVRRPVRLGARGEGVVEVLEGLSEGARVLGAGPGTPPEGARVRVREQAPPPELARAL